MLLLIGVLVTFPSVAANFVGGDVIYIKVFSDFFEGDNSGNAKLRVSYWGSDGYNSWDTDITEKVANNIYKLTIASGYNNSGLTIKRTSQSNAEWGFINITKQDGKNLLDISNNTRFSKSWSNSWSTYETQQPCATPTITQSGNTVTIACSTDGADIYYTTNGSTPTTSSTKYTAAFDITSNCTVKAIAVKSGWTNSEVASKAVTYTAPASSDVTFYVKNDGNWDDLRVWAWDVKNSNTTIFSVKNGYSDRPYITNFNSNVVKSDYTFTVEKGHVGEDVVWKITTTDNVSVNISGKSNSPATGDIASSEYNGKVLVTTSNNASFSSFTASTWEADEPVVDAYKDYKVQLKWVGNNWADYSDQGSISNGVWTISNLDLKDNGGFNLRVYDGSNYTEYGIGSNKSNSSISNNRASQLSKDNNYVYATENAVVNLSLDLKTMTLTATWIEAVAEKNKLYITGNLNEENKWGQNVYTLEETSTNVYTGYADKLDGEWKIFKGETSDGKGDYSINFGGTKDNNNANFQTLKAGQSYNVWFNSSINFKTAINDRVKITLTIKDGYNNESDKKACSLKIEAAPLEDYVYFVNTKKWSNPKIYLYTNKYTDSNGQSHPEVNNGPWNNTNGGAALTEKVTDVKEALGEDCDVYRYKVDMDKYQQVIFNDNGGTQTRNYHLVSGGVYYPDADLLPDNYWYTDDQMSSFGLSETAENNLDVYPNDNVSTAYNNCYVDDALLFDYLLEGTLENGVFTPKLDDNGELMVKDGKHLCIDIEKENVKVYTGNKNTTNLVPVMIGGKVFLRLALGEDILASGSDGLKVAFYVNTNESEPEGTNFTLETQPYHDGIVYYRDGTTKDIKDLVTPTRVYVVAKGNGVTFKNGTTLSADGQRNLVKSTNSANKVLYTLSNVAPGSAFEVYADFDNNGEVARRQYGANASITLAPGQRKECAYQETGVYTIFTPQASQSNNYYNVAILWEDEEIYITPVPKGSQLAINDNKGYCKFDAKKDYVIQISHDGYFGSDESHYNVYSTHGFTNYEDENGNLLHSHVDFTDGFVTENFGAESGTTEVSHLTVNAPMGGVFAVKVSHDPIPATGYSYSRTSVNVPVRVIPTVESVGLYIQGQPVAAVKNGSSTGYAVYIPELEMDDEWHYKGYDGYDQSIVTWDPEKRVKIQCVDEHAAQTENNGNKSAAVIYIKKGESAQAVNKYAPSVLKAAATTALAVTDDEYESDREGFSKYSIYNTLTRNDENPSFYIEQNGVASEPATLTIAKTPGEFNTLTGQYATPVGVENFELDGADEDVEAVYYNLNGVRVNAETLAPGLYIIVKGNHSEKILVK